LREAMIDADRHVVTYNKTTIIANETGIYFVNETEASTTGICGLAKASSFEGWALTDFLKSKYMEKYGTVPDRGFYVKYDLKYYWVSVHHTNNRPGLA
jgi:hypothetical protein